MLLPRTALQRRLCSRNSIFLSYASTVTKKRDLTPKYVTGQLTKRVRTEKSEWKKWNWRSEGDMLVNGAFFRQSGGVASASYESASSLAAKPASMVDLITSTAGALGCRRGKPCY